jgi:fatty acid desaturase
MKVKCFFYFLPHLLSHFAITHKPWVWKLVGATHDFFNGASMLAWIHQHTFGHHSYTNIDGADPDVVTGEAVSILVRDDKKSLHEFWH